MSLVLVLGPNPTVSSQASLGLADQGESDERINHDSYEEV